MRSDFKGKRALVTGGSRGIGKGIVRALIEAGADVFALARTQANLDKLKVDLPTVNIVCVDLADWDATRQAVETLGDIDLLVNNAAALGEIKNHEPFIDASKSVLDLSIDVNLKSAFNISQVVARNMIKRSSGGAIVNMSSVAGLKPFAGMVPYNVSKAGLDMLTKVMALELGPSNIRVNSVCPTVVQTEYIMERMEKFKEDPAMQEKVKESMKRHPLGGFTKTDDIVNATLFLLSDKAAMVTGTVLPVDDGYMVT